MSKQELAPPVKTIYFKFLPGSDDDHSLDVGNLIIARRKNPEIPGIKKSKQFQEDI